MTILPPPSTEPVPSTETETDLSPALRETSRPPEGLSQRNTPALRASPLPTIPSRDLQQLLGQAIDGMRETLASVDLYRRDLTDPEGVFIRKMTDVQTVATKQHQNTMIALAKVERDIVVMREQMQKILLLQGDEPTGSIPVEKPYSVLVVDDEPGIPEACSRNLTKEGVVVYTARNVETALLVMIQHRIDVVLCDLIMPGNGSTLARHLKDEHPEVVIVLMTAHDAGRAASEALEQGAFGFLAKPFPREQLQLTIERAVQFARNRR